MNMAQVVAKFTITIIIVLIIIRTLILIPETVSEAEKEAKAEMEFIETNAEEFSFYLDGVEVEYDNISLEQYDMDYDLDSKKVFLTKKTGRDSIAIIPIFSP